MLKLVSVVMGSESDREMMGLAVQTLWELAVPCESQVLSAHRTPHKMMEYAREAWGRGLRAIIAGAGGAAHLPGMLAAFTTVPVLGVPIPSEHLRGLDSLLSIVQMPAGVPVATFAIGKAGAVNAAVFAAQMVAVDDPDVARRLQAYRERQATKSGE